MHIPDLWVMNGYAIYKCITVYIYTYIYYGYEPFTIRGKVFQVAYIDGVAAKTIEPNGGWTLMETTMFDFQNMGHFPLRVN